MRWDLLQEIEELKRALKDARDAAKAREKGQTTSELAKELGVKWDTAAHIQRRLATALARPGLIQQLHESAWKARSE